MIPTIVHRFEIPSVFAAVRHSNRPEFCPIFYCMDKKYCYGCGCLENKRTIYETKFMNYSKQRLLQRGFLQIYDLYLLILYINTL